MYYNELQHKFLGVSVRNAIGEYVADDTHMIVEELEWQKTGLQQTVTGYGSKLTTPYKIFFNNRYYRVYATCYGNAASHWFKAKNIKYFID